MKWLNISWASLIMLFLTAGIASWVIPGDFVAFFAYVKLIGEPTLSFNCSPLRSVVRFLVSSHVGLHVYEWDIVLQ